MRKLTLLLPRAVSADAVDGDAGDMARWGGVREELGFGPDVGLGKVVKQLGRTALGDPGTTRDDEVVIQATRLPAGLHGEDHARVSLDIFHLLVRAQMGAHDFLSLQAGPDDGDVRAAVGIEGHQVGPGVPRSRLALPHHSTR